MSDAALRADERAAMAGDREAARRYLAALDRAGVTAYLGYQCLTCGAQDFVMPGEDSLPGDHFVDSCPPCGEARELVLVVRPCEVAR